MNKSLPLIAAVCLAGLAGESALAEKYQVNDLQALAKLVGETAEPGDVIEVLPGTYFLEVPRISVQRSGEPEHAIVIRGVLGGGKRPVIDASKVNVQRCVFAVGPGVHDVVFENLDICHAAGSRFPDRRTFGVNATAIYFDGSHNITVRNCISHHNEDGFFATRTADYILIDGCEVHHNGTTYTGRHNRTHNFYFCAGHQMVKNCYIHHSTEGENFKSRGENTIFAFNWVDEEAIYSVAVDSGGRLNTLWLGNVIMKRTQLGHGQGRLLGIGDGTGVASGKLVAINNTFVTSFPRDFYLYTDPSSTGEAVFINNVFAGPGQGLFRLGGSGKVSGDSNWIADAAGALTPGPSPARGEGSRVTLTRTSRGDDPGFVDAAALDFRLKKDSPLASAGISPQEYREAVRLVTDNARSGGRANPSPAWIQALEEIERPAPAFVPVRQGLGRQPRPASAMLAPGAYPVNY